MQWYMRISYYWSIGFGLGLVKFAPGTIGSLLALPCWYITQDLKLGWQFILLVVIIGLSCISADKTAKYLKQKDPSIIVCDEVVGFWLVLLFVPNVSIIWLLIAFFLFRLFDIFKPWPIKIFDAIDAGWAIVIDDILAAIYAILSLYVLSLLYGVGAWFY